MNIQQRLDEVKQKYANLKQEREQLITRANELADEMNRLDGEFRILVELQNESTQKPDVKVKDKPSKKEGN